MSDVLLDVSDVTLRFGGLYALRDVSLQVPRGKVVGIIGPNGAGKTSLLNCASGSYRPQSGSIRLNGREVIGQSPSTVASYGVARTFQSVQVIPDRTVLENILVGRHLKLRRGVFSSMLYWGRARADEMHQRDVVHALADTYGVDLAAECRAEVMTWDEIRTMAADPLVTIGAHTKDHYAVAKLDEAIAMEEMVGSAERIEQELGTRPAHFAFPYGDPGSAGTRDFALASKAGFTTAVTTRSTRNCLSAAADSICSTASALRMGASGLRSS